MNKELKKYRKQIGRVRSWQKRLEKLSDGELAACTDQFRARRKQGESLDRLLPEAFAVVCEADRRVLGKNPYDVQIWGGIALHNGCLAEIGTGEGKTLTATMPMYLNAIEGKGAILVTTNEYLALRDYEEMGPVYRLLGLTVEAGVRSGTEKPFTNDEKRKIYSADIVYTTHGVLGFDYLFNNLVTSAGERFMRNLNYVIIDEADSVLLDSAQTPLVISGSPRVQSNLYGLANTFVTLLRENVDYEKEDGCVWLTPEGIRQAESFFRIENFYDDRYFEINRHVILALRAHMLFEKGKDYTVSNDGSLVLLDTGTGRVMPGVKLRGGQHQALEVKEGIPESIDSRSVASITFQNLFLLFDKMSGMSGTILESKRELEKVYHTRVLAIPANKPVIRRDLPDLFFPGVQEKFGSAVECARKNHKIGRPVLIVASTIDETEQISRALIQLKIPHNVLNANNAYWEASIISEAGQRDAVTVATAMAGRGTDIRLGEGVEQLGGLAVIGVGRMANQRIERQVRGRAGRQGDPGTSQFFVSIRDEVTVRNQIDQVEKIGESKRTPSKRKLSRVILRAQSLEEEYAIQARKVAMDYDKIMKKQRTLIYDLRNRLLDGGTISVEDFYRICRKNIKEFLKTQKKTDEASLNRFVLDNIAYSTENPRGLKYRKKKQTAEYLMERVRKSLAEQKKRVHSQNALDSFMRLAVLNAIDEAWVEQVDYLHQLESAVSGRFFAQRNVTHEFEDEAHAAFRRMETMIRASLMRSILLSSVQVDSQRRLHIIFR